MAKKTAIGIDLGTTYSCVGVFQHGKVEIIANDQGNRTTPSYVAFTDTERLIGDAAKNQVAMNPTNTIFDAKRLIGRGFSDASVQSDMKHWPFKVSNAGGKPRLSVEHKCEKSKLSSEELSSAMSALDEALQWLDGNQLGEKEEYEDKQRQLENMAKPLMNKIYGGGAQTCGQQQQQSSGSTGAGPTIEEVD